MSWIRELGAAQDVNELSTSQPYQRETLSQLRDAGRHDRSVLEEDLGELELQEESL